MACHDSLESSSSIGSLNPQVETPFGSEALPWHPGDEHWAIPAMAETQPGDPSDDNRSWDLPGYTGPGRVQQVPQKIVDLMAMHAEMSLDVDAMARLDAVRNAAPSPSDALESPSDAPDSDHWDPNLELALAEDPAAEPDPREPDTLPYQPYQPVAPRKDPLRKDRRPTKRGFTVRALTTIREG